MMFVESRTLPDGTIIESDVCVIGAGAAGIAIAHALIGSGLRVALLESGGFDFEEATQALAAGTLKGPGREPIDASRLRYFGGSTNHWAGWCRPLDRIDFESRPGIPGSGWPITRATLDPFYPSAMALCELGPDDWDDPAAWMPTPPTFDPARLALRIFQVSPPTRFGEAYRAALAAAANITVYLHANATGLLATPSGTRVEQIAVRSLAGTRFTVTARETVLATGGLENARLLLLSGLGNHHDMVGRCFMDHPWIPLAGLLRFTEPPANLSLLLGEQPMRGTTAFAALHPSPALLRAEPIGNFRAVLTPLARVSEGMDSLRALLGAAAGLTWPPDAWEHLRRILADTDLAADRLYRRLTGAATSPFTTPPRPGTPPQGALIDLNIEQFPNRESRVTLGPDRDALGQPRLIVDWRLGESERRTFARALHLLGLECGRLGLGRVNVAAATAWPPPDLRGSRHHMGTTRMAADPREGVVDADCRVHGIANLSIAGSSVFPTAGAANPTLTIVALALRLADDLRRRLG